MAWSSSFALFGYCLCIGLSSHPIQTWAWRFSFCLTFLACQTVVVVVVIIIITGCQQYLDRFTRRHDSILNFIAKSLQPVINVHSSLYADVNGFLNPSIITGENYRLDLLFLIQSKCLYVLELTVGFESNLNNNAVRKKEKYLNLINEMSRNYRCVRFVNLSMSSLSVFSDECSTFLDMTNDIGIDQKQ